MHSVVKNLQEDLGKTNLEEFYIKSYKDYGGKLLLVGSFDFSYYHDVEVIFYDVSYICCPTSYFTVNRFRVADENENVKFVNLFSGEQYKGQLIALDDTFLSISYYILANNMEYNFSKFFYFNEDKTKEELISDWAKERLLNLQ